MVAKHNKQTITNSSSTQALTGTGKEADAKVFCFPSLLASCRSAISAFLCCSNSPSSLAFSAISRARNEVTSSN